MSQKNDRKKSSARLLGGTILAAFGASLCCITPVLALFAGVSGVASTFSWLEPLRPVFIGLTALMLGWAWYDKLKPRNANGIECACEDDAKKSFFSTKTFLGIVTVIAALLLSFPYYSGIFFPKNQNKVVIVQQGDIIHARLSIQGMTCTGCENAVNHALGSTEGVVEATSDYKTGKAEVTFDKSQTTIENLAAAIKNEVGYTVTGHEILTKTN